MQEVDTQLEEEYINKHYSAPRIVLAAAGGVDHDALVKLAEQNFNGLRSTYESQDVLQPCRYTGSEIRFRDDDMPLAHIAIAVEGLWLDSPRLLWTNGCQYAYWQLGQVLQRWKKYQQQACTGRGLFDMVQSNLAHSFMSFLTPAYTDTGLWLVYNDLEQFTCVAYTTVTLQWDIPTKEPGHIATIKRARSVCVTIHIMAAK
ncbi:hypothetical protein OS493_040407 [Desmophyllum pertusum]|uniref:Peptidase M16 C-terminal domain-containing protein n=1 Tax=Desmophyllum pertusum TaxID=174260 RepID=A0A9X0CZS7_9CNID|nr:hypothetical protein OS493_040407 [Desmophyllum pertusum]